MAPLVKLAVVFKSGEEASFLQHWFVFLHPLYTVVEKQPYLVSTSSYQLSVQNIFVSHVRPILMVLTKITWRKVTTHYVTVILDRTM